MITDFFTQAIVVQRVTRTENLIGGYSETWSTHLSFNGLIDYISGQADKVAEQYADKATHVLMCEVGKDITVFDQVIFDSEIYRILHVDSPFNRHMEILLEYVGVDNNA